MKNIAYNTHGVRGWRKFVACSVSLALVLPWAVIPTAAQAQSTEWDLATVPLYVSVGSVPNVLLIMDNSNSMDERPNGSAAGSADSESKSEIARGVAKNLISTYTDKINMGLMAYQQSAIETNRYIYESPYDLSYDPNDYDPDLDLSVLGARAGQKKKYRMVNPSDPARFIYYNVNLPMYSTSAKDQFYCYSSTANAAPTAAKPSGFGLPSEIDLNRYTCYLSKTGTSNGSDGFSNSLGTSNFTPTDSDYAQDIYVFGHNLATVYVGPTWYSAAFPGRGYLHVPVKWLDAAHAAKLNTKLGTSQFTTNAPTDASYPLQNAGQTPIAGTLLTALDYFKASMGHGAWMKENEGYTKDCYAPDLGSCGYNYVILLTDGLPSTKAGGGQIDDPESALEEASDAAKDLLAEGVKTYVVGFALPVGVDPDQLTTIAEAGGTGAAFSADDETSLKAALQTIFASISTEAGSSAAVASSSSSFMVDNYIFQTSFTSSDWSGDLVAFKIIKDKYDNPVISDKPQWGASANIPAANQRIILTTNPSYGQGIAFRWPADPVSPAASELDVFQTTALGSSSILEYIRGNDGAYRKRSSKLGDLVNSAPVYVGPAVESYGETDASYIDFKYKSKDRTPMVYAGANDGMLHGFSAADGKEKIAYVPSMVFDNLPSLAATEYASFHKYFVDGSPSVSDVKTGTGIGAAAWKTVLVGGLNAGGQGYYALDVTDPDKFSESKADATVLWEFTDRERAPGKTNYDNDLGYTYSIPTIGQMQGQSWVAIFGNGYNNMDDDGFASATGNAVLYIVDIQTGELIRKLDTGRGLKSSSLGKSNGLSSPAAVDMDYDGVIDYIYAGDLQGNMWKFDVRSSNPLDWGVAYGNTPVFTTLGGDLQPITTRPEVAKGPDGSGLMVYFGTGKYFEITVDSDPLAQKMEQAFYGVWDRGNAITDTAKLVKQMVLPDTVAKTTGNYRVVSDEPFDNTKHLAWYLELPTKGERQVTNSMFSGDAIVFTTLIPEQGECSAGGSSWLMELDRKTGGRLSYSFADVNGDGYFNAGDQVKFSPDDKAPSYYVGGWQATGGTGIYSAPLILPKDGQTQVKLMSSSTGGMVTMLENNGRPTGRLSWRELLID